MKSRPATTSYYHPPDPRCPAAGSYLTQRYCALCDQENESIVKRQLEQKLAEMNRKADTVARFARAYDDMTYEQRIREEAVMLHLYDMLCELDRLSYNRLRARVRRMRRRVWQRRPEYQLHDGGCMLDIMLDVFNFTTAQGKFIQDSNTYRPIEAPEID